MRSCLGSTPASRPRSSSRCCLRSPRVLSLPEAGHLPNLERPDEFNRELLDFLLAAAP